MACTLLPLASVLSIIATLTTVNASPRHGWHAFHQGNFYFFSDERLSWHHAWDACVEQGGHLVEIGSSAEQAFLENSLQTIDGDSSTMPQIQICEAQFRNDHQIARLNCPTGTFINLEYVNYGRTQPYASVCNYGHGIDRTDCLPQERVTQRARDSCQGRQSCELTYRGLDLWDTCLNTYKYFEVRYSCTTQVGSDPYHPWIGLNDLHSEGQFVWENSGRPGYYTNWSPEEPNNLDDEHCVQLGQNRMWNDAVCSDQKKFICEL